MIDYVYLDAYGHARRTISEEQLAETYQNNPDCFLEAMCRSGSNPIDLRKLSSVNP